MRSGRHAVTVALVCALASATAAAQEGKAQLGARARTEAPEPAAIAGAREVQTLRATHGESFSLMESMPGAVPVFSGVPYLLIRGAPPGGSLELYDGAPVPSFHHVALGPSIAHPLLVSRMSFHPGVAPARYGRRLGAVLSIEAPDVAPESADGELAINAIDAHGLWRSSGTRWAGAHGRIGYPSLWLDALDAGVQLGYGDYQLRLVSPLGPKSAGSLHFFGAYDELGTAGAPEDDIKLSFHRLVARVTHRAGDLTLGSTLYAGHERGSLGQELHGNTTRVGPSMYVEQAIDADTRVRAGADMEAKLISLTHRPAPPDGLGPAPDEGTPDSFLPDTSERSFISAGPELFVDRSPLRERPARNAFGVYGELELFRTRLVRLELGLRGDTWLLPSRREHSVDPRALVRLVPSEWLELHAGIGTAHQSATSPLPVPGMADVELDWGLQRAVQAEAGARVHTHDGLELSATGFYHRFDDMVFLELVLDCEGNTNPIVRDPRLPDFDPSFVSVCRKPGLPRGEGSAYGVELLARAPSGQRLSGFATYTLAFADGEAEDGTRFTPQFDVRHLVNVVLGVSLGGGFSAGTRVHFRTGKSAVNTFFDFVQSRFEREETRLPSFFRTDLHVSYRFETSWAPMTITAGMQNVTFSREATKRDCALTPSLKVTCEVDYQPAIVLPNVGFRVEL